MKVVFEIEQYGKTLELVRITDTPYSERCVKCPLNTGDWDACNVCQAINNWNTDSANFQNFLTVIDQYIQGLAQIKADYEQAEGMNTTIGEQRTH